MSLSNRYLTGISRSSQAAGEDNNVLKLLEEQKKLSQDLLKQNTSLILLSAHLSKEMKQLKADTLVLQDSTNEMKQQMATQPKVIAKRAKGKLSTTLTVSTSYMHLTCIIIISAQHIFIGISSQHFIISSNWLYYLVTLCVRINIIQHTLTHT